jgi:integrase/recombinase XerD
MGTFLDSLDPEKDALEWLERYGLHSDGSAESRALSSPPHREWFARYVIHKTRSPESTQQNRISNAHNWLTWLEKRGVAPENTKRSHLYDHVDELIDRDMAHPSIGSRVDTIIMMYLWAEKRGHINESPFSGFELEEEYEITRAVPKQVRVLIENDPDAGAIVAISAEQVEKLIKNVGTPRLRNQLLCRLLWQTGMRCSELASVQIEHIEEGQRSISIRSAKASPDDDHYWRTVYYQENLEYQMWEWIHGGGRTSLYNGDEELSEDEGKLLVTQQNAEMRPTHISRIVKDAAKNAGINEVLYTDAAGKDRWLITGHTLRHSFATYCANGGDPDSDNNQTPMPISTLQTLMGHKSSDTTMRYISQPPETRRKHVSKYGPR